MTRGLTFHLGCLAVLGGLTAAPAAAQIIAVDADAVMPGVQATRTAVVGETMQGDVLLVSNQPVAGFDVELRFDARVLSVRQAQLVGIAAGAYQIVNGPIAGSLKVAVVRENGAQTSGAAVLRLTFDAVGNGSTALTVASSKVSGPAGTRLAVGNVDASVTVRSKAFLDDPVVAGVTLIRAGHITELRTFVDQKRAGRGLPAFAWTDPSPAVVRAVHIAELRTAIAAVYTAAGRPLPSYTDPALTPGSTAVKATHINELRAAAVLAP